MTVKKGHFAKICRFEHRRQQETKEITEPKETEECNTNKLINVITDIKLVTDRRNHNSVTLKNDGTEKNYR